MTGVVASPKDADVGRGLAERERVTVRRALVAGAATGVLLGGGLALGLASAGEAASVAGVLLGLVFGGVVTSGWLLIALAIDLWTRQPLGRARVACTIAVTLATMVSPVLPVLALRAGG